MTLIISRLRLHYFERGDYKTGIQFYRDREWKKIVANNATIYNSRAINILANKDLPVSFNNSKHLVRYCEEFQRKNLELVLTNGEMLRLFILRRYPDPRFSKEDVRRIMIRDGFDSGKYNG
ncbi:MAG: hypothetical protein K6U80_06840 [Firmicutes bacterium]|nr:hypothetical protein [Bacillota bacterium]